MATAVVTRPATEEQWAKALDRALEEALDVLVDPVSGEAFVESASNPGTLYQVSATFCSCPAGSRGIPCKHRACFLFQVGELPVEVDDDLTVDCPQCTGCGVIVYRSFEERCDVCGGSGAKPDHRPHGAPSVQPVAA